MSDAEFDVTALGAAGDGIARGPDGGTLFIPWTLPGERVRARIKGGRAVPEAWIGPASPERTDPACRHFGLCGGCALQHWESAPYAAWKRAKLAAALVRAGFPAPPVAETILIPPGTRRRADLALRRGSDGTIRLGFHAAGDPAAITDLSACAVLDARLVALFDPLRAMLKRLGTTLRREGSAVLNLLDTGPDLLLRTDGPLDAAARATLLTQ